MNNNSLPNGFITVEDATKLIGTNTFDKPVVDIKWLVSHMDWVEELHNFRIPKVRLITQDEIKEFKNAHPGKRPKDLVQIGSEFVYIATSYEKEAIKKAIRDNYRSITNHEYVAPVTRGISTVKDEETGGSEKPRVTKKTIAKEGDIIGAGTSSTTNSADGAGV